MKKILVAILMFIIVLAFTSCGDESLPVIDSLNDLNGKKIGVITGSLNEDVVYENFEDSGEPLYVNSIADAIVALENGKIDGFIFDDPTAKCISLDNPEITYLNCYLSIEQYGFAFAKTAEAAKLRNQMNFFIKKCMNNGDLAALEQKWINEDYKVATDLSEIISLNGKNGKITFVVDAVQKPPIAFLRDGKIVGFEVDFVTLFCQEYGYTLEVVDMTTDAMFSAVETGKADFAGSGLNLTKERATVFNYSNAYYTGGTVAVVRDATVVKSDNLFINLRDSFVSAFITESRWEMFAKGIGVTLLISISSLTIGAIVGYGAFLSAYYYGGNYKKFVDGFVKVVDGVPVLVLLMIFYYLIFGSIDISGIIISIFCFSLTFASSTISMLFSALDSIDCSQEEVARSLGYTKVQAFVKILLPQIFQAEYDAFRSEVVYIIQSTSVVGFIAVTDLTKANDLIRARTYDAFFPLLLIAIVYFLLAFIVAKIVGLVVKAFNPRNRKPEDILKGVNIND